jgi:tetratricopeptide (TPR) repeat protein
VSWGVNLEELAAARDELAVEVGERAGSHPLERLARAHRWLGEEDAARARFLQAAAAAQAALERSGRDDAGAASRIGSLLWRARDEAAAAPWLARAARSLTRPDDAAALSYLRGDYEAAVEHAERAIADERAMGGADVPHGGAGERRAAAGADVPHGGAGERRPAAGADDGGTVGGAPGGLADSPYPWAEAVAALAAARRDRDPARAAAAADRFAALIRAERVSPDEESGSSELSLFDWLEEAARARAELEGRDGPAHASVLEQAGLLRAERGPQRPQPQPDAGPARPGSATIAYPGPDGGEVHPSVTVDDARDIHFVLDRDLRASLVQHDGMWRARLGDTDLPGTFRGPRGAKRALWDPLREQPNGQWAVALLDRLFRESFRL